MLSVNDAFARLCALIEPVGLESVSIDAAAGRVLRRDLFATRTQPPVSVSAMDGYAVRAEDAVEGATLRVVGAVAAGDAPGLTIQAGEAARIFTGAAMPEGADAIALQEEVEASADSIRLSAPAPKGAWVRRAGQDFEVGAALLAGPKRLRPEDVALAAAGGAPWLDVARRPRVSLIAMGDELRRPGETTPPGAIISSNQYGVAALARAAGALVETPPIAPDNLEQLIESIKGCGGADIIATLGGASEGDHDLARPAFAALGADLSFYKIAMRPGKPLSVGKLGASLVLGLPGNPVSAMVCARLFLEPAIAALQGLPDAKPKRYSAVLEQGFADSNGPREHYMRAQLAHREGVAYATPFERQDSALLSVLSAADCLVVRPPHDPPRSAGSAIEYLAL